MLKVYQIVFTKDQVDAINSESPTPLFYRAYLDTMLGNMDKALILNLHQHVADVATDDLEDAFRIMNVWSATDEAKVTRHSDLHSLSVGGILEKEDGSWWVVASAGFEEISRFDINRRKQFLHFIAPVNYGGEFFPYEVSFKIPTTVDEDKVLQDVTQGMFQTDSPSQETIDSLQKGLEEKYNVKTTQVCHPSEGNYLQLKRGE